MSWQAVKHVIDNSSHSGSRLLMLIVIAETIGDNDAGCWWSIPKLGKRCRVEERAARKIIRELVASGELTREDRTGRTSIFRLANWPETPAQTDRGTPEQMDTPPLNGRAGHPCTNGHPTPAHFLRERADVPKVTKTATGNEPII